MWPFHFLPVTECLQNVEAYVVFHFVMWIKFLFSFVTYLRVRTIFCVSVLTWLIINWFCDSQSPFMSVGAHTLSQCYGFMCSSFQLVVIVFPNVVVSILVYKSKLCKFSLLYNKYDVDTKRWTDSVCHQLV